MTTRNAYNDETGLIVDAAVKHCCITALRLLPGTALFPGWNGRDLVNKLVYLWILQSTMLLTEAEDGLCVLSHTLLRAFDITISQLCIPAAWTCYW